MPRLVGLRLVGRLAAALAATLVVPLAVRAQAPLNPLRPVLRMPLVAPAGDVFAEIPPAPIRLASATEDLPEPEPESVVPPNLGQPADMYGGQRYGFFPSGQPEEHWPAAAPAHDAATAIGHPTWFTHEDPNDPYRHVGVGQPLVGTSWLNRPLYVGVFLGGLFTDDLIHDEVLSNNSYFMGCRLGWDFDHYWGLEGRYAFSRPQINNAAGQALDNPSRDYFVDVSLQYYPWGDARWRPYVSLGLGVQTFRFFDANDERIHQTLLSLPIGVGVKYYFDRNCTLRFDFYDNLAFGDGRLDTMNNFSLMAGVELRFGGRTVHYYPWHGNIGGW